VRSSMMGVDHLDEMVAGEPPTEHFKCSLAEKLDTRTGIERIWRGAHGQVWRGVVRLGF
jgi:hypothetical protein